MDSPIVFLIDCTKSNNNKTTKHLNEIWNFVQFNLLVFFVFELIWHNVDDKETSIYNVIK